MRTSRAHALVAILLGLAAARASAAPDFSGVWGMVQHDRLGAPFFIPIEPKLNTTGRAVTEAFVAKYDVKNHEAKGAGLISQLDQSILRRVPELSF